MLKYAVQCQYNTTKNNNNNKRQIRHKHDNVSFSGTARNDSQQAIVATVNVRRPRAGTNVT